VLVTTEIFIYSSSTIVSEENISGIMEQYNASVDKLGDFFAGRKSLRLRETPKRDEVYMGPYSHVGLFGAANRIMSDLVILHSAFFGGG
jgi:hypothetical protein